MLRDSIKKIDNWIIFAGLLYIILPVVIFLFKFTRPGFFVFGSILLIYLIFCTLKEAVAFPGFEKQDILNKKSLIFFLVSAVIFFIWLYFSGIGCFSFQNWDFWVRNPIYNDLVNRPWPMYYDLSIQPENVQMLIGGDWVAFAYYFTYWLLPAAFCKVMNLSGTGADIVLFAYSLAGIIIVHFLLCRLFKKFSWKITAIFMTFSGLDVVAYIVRNLKLPALTDELEWSLIYYQLSGNTTQLYYVFNQSIPIWIIMLLILNISNPKLMAGIGALCFAYSPWATIGLVPIIIVGMGRGSVNGNVDGEGYQDKGKNAIGIIKSCLSISNILVPVFLLVVFGLYYTASSGSSGGKGLYFTTTGASVLEYMAGFIVFVLTEFGLYYIAAGRRIFKYRYSVIVFWELLLFPLFYIVDFNFFIRGTIPALFILMIMMISYVTGITPDGIAIDAENKNNEVSADTDKDAEMDTDAVKSMQLRKKILAVLLVIGAMTSVIAFTRSAIYTARGEDILEDDIATFDDMSDANEYQILTVNSQFFVHGFAGKPFYRYISKRGL